MTSAHPNIVVFISGRQHWNSLGAIGTRGARPPHVDWIARQGETFQRA